MNMESSPEIECFLMKYPCDLHFDGMSSPIISNVLLGKFRNNLDESLCNDILSSLKLNHSFEDEIKKEIETRSKRFNENQLYELLCIGISSLQLFVKNNWTGPLEDDNYDPPLQQLRKCLTNTDNVSESEWTERLNNNLILDGESISPNIHNLELLLLARAILTSESFNGLASAKWWLLRCLSVHQQVLEERSPQLYDKMIALYNELTEVETIRVSAELYSQLLLEMSSVWLQYGYVGSADESIKTALKVLQLSVNLVGALGKRTKFQQKELAQLTLSVDVNRDEDSVNDQTLPDMDDFPKDVKLDDDVRLNQIEFSDTSAGQTPSLTPAEQAAIMASCVHRQKSQPKDKLQAEEILPYLTCLTSQPKVWCLQFSALLHRSKIDSGDKRTVERSLMQYQSLSNSISSGRPCTSSRLMWFYCSYLPPAWKVEALLADVYISLGMVQTALDVFLRLQLWEEVIACYNFLKLRHKAAEVIRQELDKKRTVKLLCLLGDATDDVDCYQQAWELSGHRSGRAQRHWAMYYFSRKQYGESIPHFEESLRLNSLQESLWFRLGYAALDQENWELCATAYRRYCTLEPESFEAWNNLAKAYVMAGQKSRAFHSLQEAVKCNYENWKVWDNLMAVSTDCGQFEEVIRCYHRILDLKEKHVDLEVLKIMTHVIAQGYMKMPASTLAQLKKQALTLFGRLTSQVLTDSTVWQLYAQLAASDDSTPENKTKVAQCLQKAYRAATQGSWVQDLITCQQVIYLCIDLAKAYLLCANQCVSSTEIIQLLSSAKLPLKSVLTKIEKEHTDLITGQLPEILSPTYKELLSNYEDIVDEMQRNQTT